MEMDAARFIWQLQILVAACQSVDLGWPTSGFVFSMLSADYAGVVAHCLPRHDQFVDCHD